MTKLGIIGKLRNQKIHDVKVSVINKIAQIKVPPLKKRLVFWIFLPSVTLIIHWNEARSDRERKREKKERKKSAYSGGFTIPSFAKGHSFTIEVQETKEEERDANSIREAARRE